MTFLPKKTAQAVPVTPIGGEEFDAWLKKQDARTRTWAKSSGFDGAAGTFFLVPSANGALARVVLGVGKDDSIYTYADLPAKLPKGAYYIDKKLAASRATEAALGWALGCYAFTRYKTGKKKEFSSLVWPDGADRKYVTASAEALSLARDLINTPSNDMGPEELAGAAKKLAAAHKAVVKTIVGDDLLKQNYPTIHAVGKGSARAPRLIDLRWGNPKNPKLTLVGKGVCFDTGGLDIKPASGMELMKKDMGGGAFALGLAHMVMSARLPVRLRVLIPAVENAVDGNSFRPRDVIKTRKGLTVEIGDTDAEGRLVLCDAIAEACAEKPALLMDFATLTGAARAALGSDLPALFCNDDKISAPLLKNAHEIEDPLWLMPLWQPYAEALSSKVADANNIGGQAGAITAALFLQKFVEKGVPWVHLDFSGWNYSNRPGRPEGGEARGMRACFALIEKKFK
jgi:leucyl aminopeptidase